jgi:hypothetical protein
MVLQMGISIDGYVSGGLVGKENTVGDFNGRS